MWHRETTRLMRYAIVGVISNAIGYSIYLLITWLGAGPKITMTLLYAVGTGAAYFGNRRWTFGHTGAALPSIIKFCLAYGAGYGINWALLAYFVDHAHYPHQWVQAVAIFVVAGFLFLTLRLLVFAHDR